MYGGEKRSKKRTPSASISSAFCQVLSFIFYWSRNLQLDRWQLQGLPVAPSGSPEVLYSNCKSSANRNYDHCEGEIIIVTLSHFFLSESQLTPSKSSSLKSLTKVAESSAALTVRYLSDVPKISKVLACVDLRWSSKNKIQKCWVSTSLWDWNTRSWSDHLISYSYAGWHNLWGYRGS